MLLGHATTLLGDTWFRDANSPDPIIESGLFPLVRWPHLA
jgi:hypothetical protein